MAHSRIGHCLDALLNQTSGKNVEILVVNDGSTDNTVGVVERSSGVRLISQANAGPAAARNRGALEARGTIILFTDDDCVATPDWLDAMLEPFQDPEVVGAKGVYRTRQTSLVARFVQIEYEDRYRLMRSQSSIDFIDTYSAAFRRDRFLAMNGYDISFPVACAEDIELSYRMSARGCKMQVRPEGDRLSHASVTLWRNTSRRNTSSRSGAYSRCAKIRCKAVRDSHTPQLMKLQLLFAPVLLLAFACDLALRPAWPASLLVLAAFLVSTLPFTLRAFRKDAIVGLLSPALLAARAWAQLLGVAAGLFYARHKSAQIPTKSAA